MPQQLREIYVPSQGAAPDFEQLASNVADDAWRAEIATWAFPEPAADAISHEPGPGIVLWAPLREKAAAARARWAAIRARFPMPTAANDDVPAPLPVLVTKARPPRRRRSHARQVADAQEMRAHAKATKGEVVKDPSTFKSLRSRSDKRALAPWEDAGELPQIMAVNRAVAILGVPYAFSVNLHPNIIQAANANARGFLDFIRRRVARHLKHDLGRGVSFWFAVETDEEGRPHLHGGLALNDNDRPEVAQKALAKSGGNWTRQGSAPAHTRDQYDPDGWALYPLKRIGRTKRNLRRMSGLAPGARVTIWTCTDDLRTAGKRLHEEARQAVQEACQRPIPLQEAATATVPARPASEPLTRSALHQGQTLLRYPWFAAVSMPSICCHSLRIEAHGPDPPGTINFDLSVG